MRPLLLWMQNMNFVSHSMLFPPSSADEGIKSVPSVCMCVCQRFPDWPVWCTGPKWVWGLNLDNILNDSEAQDCRSEVKVTELKNVIFEFSDMLTCAGSLCHVIRHHVTSWRDVMSLGKNTDKEGKMPSMLRPLCVRNQEKIDDICTETSYNHRHTTIFICFQASVVMHHTHMVYHEVQTVKQTNMYGQASCLYSLLLIMPWLM